MFLLRYDAIKECRGGALGGACPAGPDVRVIPNTQGWLLCFGTLLF
jgi:hypothetical protein